jgi:hypothetical protein
MYRFASRLQLPSFVPFMACLSITRSAFLKVGIAAPAEPT